MNINSNLSNNQDDVNVLRLFFKYLKSKNRTSTLIVAMEHDYLQLVSEINSKKFRQLTKEMYGLLRETFTLDQRREFNLLLVNEGVPKIELFNMTQILKLIAKKKIKTKDEYQLLFMFVEENFKNKEYISLIEKINEILNDFDKNS